MRVLLVEDDAMIGAAVADSLREDACAVDWVQNGTVAISAISTQAYDIVLLDLGLPGKDGFEVLAQIRKIHSALPVIIITARDAVESRIKGLDGGADDYVLKPFALSELQARIRAVVRRKSGSADPLLTNGFLTLNPSTHEVRVNEDILALSGREFALLHALMLRPGALLSRSVLEDRIYGWGEEVESNAIEFLIHSLRRKLGKTAIKNVRGVGWMVSAKK